VKHQDSLVIDSESHKAYEDFPGSEGCHDRFGCHFWLFFIRSTRFTGRNTTQSPSTMRPARLVNFEFFSSLIFIIPLCVADPRLHFSGERVL